MTQLSSNRTVRRGRVFPEKQLSLEEKARRKAESEELNRRCQIIFDRVKPELIEDYYDWFIIIEPNSGDYFIEQDEMIALQKARDKYPDTKSLMLRINETGACGKI